MKFLKKTSPTLLLLSIVSAIGDISSEMVNPILPLLIKSLGGTGIAIGIAGGIRDSIDSLLRIYFGYLSDKIGNRKDFVISGYITSIIFRTSIFLANTWQSVSILIGLERIGKALRTAPRDAIVADESTTGKGRGFGTIRAFNSTGAIIGSFFTLVLFWYYNFSFKALILTSGIFGLISILPLSFLKEQKNLKKEKSLTMKLSFKEISKELKAFISISALFYLANFSYMFLILKTEKAFSGKTAIAIAILLYVLFNIFYASFSIPFGLLADKIGRKKVITLGYLCFSLTFAGFAIFNNIFIFIILFMLYGIGSSIIEVNQRAYTVELSNGNRKGCALGLLHAMITLVALCSNTITGILWEKISPTTPFILGSILSFIAAILLFKNKKLP